jgi:hypothetical protein
MKCPNCGENNPDGAAFCQECAFRLSASSTQIQPPSQLQPLQDLHPQPPRVNRTIWIAVAVIVVVAVLAIAALASVFYFFTNRHTPEGAVVSWLFSAGFGNAEGTADKTIAKVVGGEVYNETRQWYSDFLAQYQGNTHVSISTVTVVTGQNISSYQRGLAEDAIALLGDTYKVTVTDYCYASFHLTGLGHYDQEMNVGLLKVGHSWYIGYATNVVDLGNI